MSNDISIRPV